jgi:hypothetical protein
VGGAAGPPWRSAPTGAGAPRVSAATTAVSTGLVQKPKRPPGAGRGCERGPPRPGSNHPPGACGSSAPRPRRHCRVGSAACPGEPSAPPRPGPRRSARRTRPGQPSQPHGQKVLATIWVNGLCRPAGSATGARSRERPGGWETRPNPAPTNAQPSPDFQRRARGSRAVQAARAWRSCSALACNSAA